MTDRCFFCCDCEAAHAGLVCQHAYSPCVRCQEKARSAAALLGALGGKAGTGKAKRRGDSDYYKRLRKRVGKAEP